MTAQQDTTNAELASLKNLVNDLQVCSNLSCQLFYTTLKLTSQSSKHTIMPCFLGTTDGRSVIIQSTLVKHGGNGGRGVQSQGSSLQVGWRGSHQHVERDAKVNTPHFCAVFFDRMSEEASNQRLLFEAKQKQLAGEANTWETHVRLLRLAGWG